MYSRAEWAGGEKEGPSSPTNMALQMVQLQKVILAVGMFSIFEAALQDGLKCRNGFEESKKILNRAGMVDLSDRFDVLCLAINVLKHGQGRSYDTLIGRSATLPFRIKLPDEPFFSEGDVSEVSTLIEVDDEFVQSCGGMIFEVSQAIKQLRPDFC